MAALIVIAVLAGIAVALQGQLMGTMDRLAGTANSVLITYGFGALAALLFWLARRERVEAVRAIPWYAWSAGLFGLVIVGGIGYAAPRLGLGRTLVITVAAQLAAALLIDHFGWLGSPQRAFDAVRALGLAMTVGGVWLVLK